VKLYSYFRSSAAYRVRIALNLKNLPYETVPIDLLHSEQQSADYRSRNPQGLVPALENDNGQILAQSVAIMEWLEECYPEPPLLPEDLWQRALVRSMVNNIACDIHPLLNLSILNYLKGPLEADPEQVGAWYNAWIRRGFEAIESVLEQQGGCFCFGDVPTLADCCLVPQVFNARRFKIGLEDFPEICRIADHCTGLEPFAAAHPARQPDYRS
jgi:maleylacetoacetate isomerase